MYGYGVMCRGVQGIGIYGLWDTIKVEMVSYRVEVYMTTGIDKLHYLCK